MGNEGIKDASWLSEVGKHHKEWIELSKRFGGGKDAEDLVQDMYLKLHRYTDKQRIIRNGKLSKAYVYFVLKSVVNTYHKKQVKDSALRFDYIMETSIEFTEEDIEDKIAFEKICLLMDQEMENWYWYDAMLFKNYRDIGDSYRKMAKQIDISWVSIYNTIKNCKRILKYELGNKYEDYKNKDYDRI